MLKIAQFFFLLFLFLPKAQFSQGVNTNFDFSGVKQFWSIVNKLERNLEPKSTEWNSLFNTPGYKILTSGEFNREFFKKYFTLVFMPSHKNELNKTLKQRKNIHHLQHYIKVRANQKLTVLKKETIMSKSKTSIIILCCLLAFLCSSISETNSSRYFSLPNNRQVNPSGTKC